MCPNATTVPVQSSTTCSVFYLPQPVTFKDNCATFLYRAAPSLDNMYTPGDYEYGFIVSDTLTQERQSFCSFAFTVVDVSPPNITCPASVTLAAAPGECWQTATWPDPTYTDNCNVTDVVQLSGYMNGSVFPVGVQALSYAAFDAELNTKSCGFSVTILDTQPPVISESNYVTS